MEHWMNDEFQEETKEFTEKIVPVSLYPIQIPHYLYWHHYYIVAISIVITIIIIL
jgi:hypothetical protein